MKKQFSPMSMGIFLLIWYAVAAISQAAVPPATEPKIVGGGAAATATDQTPAATEKDTGLPTRIFGLVDGPSGPLISGKDKAGNDIESHVGLNGKLWVVLTQPLPLEPEKYTLFMNGIEVQGLAPAVIDSYQGDGGQPMSALVFSLQRNSKNDSFWKGLMGGVVGMHVPVVISLGERAGDGQVARQTIMGSPVTAASFEFEVIGLWRLVAVLLSVIAVVGLVWGHARTRTTLRDSYLPQIKPSLQTYSLARWQMAFWFTLIFAAFVCLFVVLWDTNTITSQALALMGISGTTALAAVEIDSLKDSPADAANRGLQALGLKTYADVQRVQQEIDSRKAELADESKHGKRTPSPTDERRKQLQFEIQDRENILRTYAVKIQPFLTQGWFKDITTDINGTTIHRLQAVCWTLVLGVVFVITVYRTLAMPEFNGTLLTLMGISSAGYVGFKFPEVNS